MPHYAVEEALADGVYSVTTTTRYNAAGQPLSSVQKRLISQLSGTLESKSVFVNERGLTSTQWTVYSGGTKRVQYSTVPGSSITAETVTVSGVALSQKDTAGITTTATRPLAIQKDGSWFTYGWDLTKNVCELYGPSGYIRTAYTYSPYGQVSSTGDVEQPIQWSSEYNDDELGLIYYNYRHYNPMDGRWIGRDKIVEMEHQNLHVYPYVANSPLSLFDILGLDAFPCNRENKGRYKELKIKIYLQTFDGDIEIIDSENANIGKIIKDEIIDRAKSKVHGDMRDRLKQKIESNEMFRSMKNELEDVANGIKKHPVFKFLKNGISTTSGTILGVKIDVEAKFCICRNGEHEFVNCHGTAETFPIRIAIASPTRHSVKQLNRLPEYFAQASYSAVEELYKVKTHHEKNNITYCGAAYAASQLHGTSIMKRIFIFLFLACICRGAEEINNELRFNYFSNSCVDISPDKYIKIDYDNSMKKQALLSMLQLATIGLISHEEFILFTRGIMIRLPIFDEKSSILENDYYIKSRHMILRVTCFPQKECSGMCLLDYSDTKKMKSLYNPVEISKLNYHKKLAREIVEGELDLKLVDANESLYDEALEYALLRIKEYIINKRKQNLSLDEQEGVSTLHQMVQILVTRMYIRQLFDPFLTMNEKAAAWYLVKDCSVNGLKKLIYKSALIKRNNGVCIYSCPEKWKQQAEEWNAQSMAENWYREIRRLYPSNTEE